MTGSVLVTIIVAHTVPAMGFFLGLFGAFGLKTTVEMIVPNVLKHQANKKLGEVVKKLKEYGVNTSRLRLSHAKLNTNKVRYAEPRGVVLELEQVAIFQDRQGKLKALRQVRSQLIEMQRRKVSGGVNYIYPDYAEVISDSDKVRQFVFTKQK